MNALPKPGTVFMHRRITDTNNQPLRCVVSAIRNGAIYYRVDGERKAKECTTADRWPLIANVIAA